MLKKSKTCCALKTTFVPLTPFMLHRLKSHFIENNNTIGSFSKTTGQRIWTDIVCSHLHALYTLAWLNKCSYLKGSFVEIAREWSIILLLLVFIFLSPTGQSTLQIGTLPCTAVDAVHSVNKSCRAAREQRVKVIES